MLKIPYKYILILLAIFVVGCAKRGNITGGLTDTIPPVLQQSIPKNFSTEFKGNEVRLVFDEYVKLKDVNKQLIVSPPMNTPPNITPTNASKYITIKIKDTLQPDTTYSFNFGQSIQDNNEGNIYPQFKYVFSTGNYIDSLSVSGRISDALEKNVANFVTVMLYEVNEKFTDSIVYKEKPRYVTNTLDSAKTWQIDNIKAGKYMLVAMKDYNNNFIFDTKKDQIGFYKEHITIPSEGTNYNLQLFNEVPVFKGLKPAQASGNRATVGYEGKPDKAKFTLKNGNEVMPTIVTKLPEKDSLQLWFQPVKADSLSLEIENENFKKEFNFKIKNQKKDSLSFNAKPLGTLHFRDKFEITSSIPLTKFDTTKITLRNKDSIIVPYTTQYDAFNQKLKFNFRKEPLEKYTMLLMPGALTDFYEAQNDTLNYKFGTKDLSDYANLTLKLENVKKFPIIVELTDEKGTVLESEYSTDSNTILFNAFQPKKFYIRIIYDDNGNGKWDPGNYLEKRQGEEVLYFPKEIEVKPNWDWEEIFILTPASP
ncbi:uncharacterized protein (DUF2141 family) [Flavobacterium arsenatis]|uniref:Uncharacterized protein (DUF2141 family) n=1 Tax=Flavobacterium arsenatis TaxID=1484332 RepID=A0ABU1TTE1_9FLAO|nr:Ig-like domain-containing domain [Flavobacterium arsenatis]MDR6969146.1 uncharacterized protein (DUF2141 family) [Flavobacterium arsenatis]